MGSLMRDPGRWILVENPASPLPLPSHLSPFHRRQNDRSPLHSPPILKKLPKVKVGHIDPPVELPSSSYTTSSSLPVHLESTTWNQRSSILRRSGGPRARGSTVSGGRRVSFDQEVVVHRFDAVDGRRVSSEGQRLGSDQKDRKEFLDRNIRGCNRSPRPLPVDAPFAGLSLSGRRGGGGVGERGGGEPPIRCAVPLTSSPPPPAAMTSQSPISCVIADRRVQGRSSSSSFSSSSGPGSETKPEVDFSFFEDAERRLLHLRLSIFLGDGIEAGDVLVKANTAGNRVRVVGTRTVGTAATTSSSGSGTREFAERYQLPVDVDPYRIRARMDGSGRLYLEAPVLGSGDCGRALGVDGPGFDSGFSDFVR